jgi:hypothetical protein
MAVVLRLLEKALVSLVDWRLPVLISGLMGAGGSTGRWKRLEVDGVGTRCRYRAYLPPGGQRARCRAALGSDGVVSSAI